MSKDSSVKYYQKTERLQKELVKGIEIFLRKTSKKNSRNMDANDMKISQKIKKTKVG